MAASTLGDILVTPPVEWDAFAKEWTALGRESQRTGGDEVDDLTNEMSNWGKGDNQFGAMLD
jgi:hypothetical protein